MNIVAMVPARIGSTRLKMKNLALINGKPMISYAIEAARNSGVFSRVVVNSEHGIFKKIADRYEAGFYQRPEKLGSSSTKSDDVVYDFMKNHPSDIVAWVNPTSPLQPAAEVRSVIEYFIEKELDSLITVKDEQVHCVYQNKPINYDPDELFAQTQDMIPVNPFVYSIMMWRCSSFIREYEKTGHALFCGETGFYPVGKLTSFIIKNQEDLMIADFIAKGLSQNPEYEVQYDPITSSL